MNRINWKKTLVTIAAPVAYALMLRWIIDFDIISHFTTVMSITFFVSLPFGVGVLTIAVSDIEKVKSIPYRIFNPWVPIGCFFALTILLAIEGWACWLMILPVFLALSSLG